MEISELQELIRVLEKSSLTELEIEENGRRIRLSKTSPQPPMPVYSQPPMAYSMPMAPPVHAAPAAPAPAEPAPAAPAAPAVETYAATIDSPMVGTFYSSASPGDPPFLVVGDTIEADQTVCIIEAMKIMNEVTAKTACVIERVLVENGEPVEFGQPLFAVRPLD